MSGRAIFYSSQSIIRSRTRRCCHSHGVRILHHRSTPLFSFSSSAPAAPSVSLADAVVHRRGDVPYGSRQYVLLPPHVSLEDILLDQNNATTRKTTKQTKDATANNESLRVHQLVSSSPLVLATLHAHRNVLFGARRGIGFRHDNKQWSLTDLCRPLLAPALEDAAIMGDQPQALATLPGLCDWIQQTYLNNNTSINERARNDWKFTNVEWDAVKAIATGVPRPGQSIVGQGTHRDAARAWEELAKRYCQQSSAVAKSTTTTDSSVVVSNNNQHGWCDEVSLYRTAGAEVVGIELLADTSPEYLKLAGGAMARLYFL